MALLRNLTDLQVSLPKGTSLSCLERLPALTYLAARNVPAADISFLNGHRKLKRVNLFNVGGQVDDITPFLDMPELCGLSIFGCKFIPDLSFIRRLPKLASLALPGLKDVTDFTHLSSQTALKDLYLDGCRNLISLDALRPLTALKGLSLSEASLSPGSLDEIVRTWPYLQSLQLMNSDWVTSLAPIAALPLKGLTINECPQLTSIRSIAHLESYSKVLK